MKKRLTAIAMSVVLTATMASVAYANKTQTFTDIANLANKEQITALQQSGVIAGVTDTEFMPEAQLTSAEGIALIVRAMELSLAAIDFNKAPMAEDLFSKVKNEQWYSDAFIIAFYNDVDVPKDIDPNKPLTKEQFVHMLVNGLEKTGNYPLIKMYIQVNDEKEMTPSYQGTIQRALLYKLTALDAKGNFDPKHVMTRGEAASMLYEAVKFVQAHKDKPQPEGDGGSK